jgi:hypothetical protein
MLGFIFRIQDAAQFIKVKIGYLVMAFPAQLTLAVLSSVLSRMLTTAASTSVFTLFLPFVLEASNSCVAAFFVALV